MMLTNRLSTEQYEIPKYKFAVMGAFDSLAGIMITFAVNYISSATLIVLVQQSAIPISMIISKFALDATYTRAQYYGAGIVMGGIIVVLLPTLFGASVPNPSTDSESSSNILWIVVLVLACIPMCCSSVYKEKALGEVEIDVWYLNGWVALFQTIIAIPLMLPSASVINMSYNQILPNMYNGLYCLMGINTITAENALPNQPVDQCEDAPLFVGIYFFFNVIYNILIILILKYGSANILFMSSTVIVPLSNIVFSLKITPNHQPMKITDMLGLVTIMCGLVIYRFYESVIVEYYQYYFNYHALSKEEEILKRKAKQIEKDVSMKQTKMVGWNQVETLATIMDSRITSAQKVNMFRTPQQARGAFLHRLGIPPSPKVQKSPSVLSGGYQMSPVMSGKRKAGASNTLNSGSTPRTSYQNGAVVSGSVGKGTSLLPRHPSLDV